MILELLRSKSIRRRVLATVALYGFAIGSALFWNEWEVNWGTLAINLASATAGLLFLHSRWREKEERAMTPRKIRDTFS